MIKIKTRFKPCKEKCCFIGNRECQGVDGWSIGARKHYRSWKVHTLKQEEYEAMRYHPCLEIDTDPDKKKTVKPVEKVEAIIPEIKPAKKAVKKKAKRRRRAKKNG